MVKKKKKILNLQQQSRHSMKDTKTSAEGIVITHK